MRIEKSGCGVCAAAGNEEELAAIRAFTKGEVRAEDLYTFAVRLCDNEVDRDGERFDRATLTELAELFVGKCGIFDHEWTAQGQTARLYRTEVVDGEGVTETGEPYCYLKGYAYMLRSEKNAALIAEIEGGIKKEVSVGCSVAHSVCSICGAEAGSCGHEKGKTYGGKLCCTELKGAVDAYEWSFVAVPAQVRAGVMKRCGGEESGTLRTLVSKRGSRAQQKEWEEMQRLAALGGAYLDRLRGEVKRLMLSVEENMNETLAFAVTEHLDESALSELERVYRGKAEKKFGLAPQLSGFSGADKTADAEEFRV